LGDYSQRIAQTVPRNSTEWLALDQTVALLHVIKALDEGNEGRYARPRWPDNPDLLSARNMKAQAVDGVMSGGSIGEADIAEFDRAGCSPQGAAFRTVPQRRTLPDHAERIFNITKLLYHIDQRQ